MPADLAGVYFCCNCAEAPWVFPWIEVAGLPCLTRLLSLLFALSVVVVGFDRLGEKFKSIIIIDMDTLIDV